LLRVGTATGGALLFDGVEEHNDDDRQDHVGSRVDDELGGDEELGTERSVEDGERHHGDDQREGAVDGVAVQQQVDGCGYFGRSESGSTTLALRSNRNHWSRLS